MERFKDKVVLITGASSGIGAELARAFAREGASLVLTARRRERLEDLEKEIAAAGGQALALAGDVTVDGAMEQVTSQAVGRFGKIDIVIVNAGFSVIGRLDRLKLEDYHRQFETNVFGALRTVYANLDELKKSQGVIVFVGSVSGYVSTPLSSAYSMSKFSLRALAESLYPELASDGISVVLISPGFVATEIDQVTNLGVFDKKQKSMVPPWIKISADKAAQQILTAVYKRKREKIITYHGKAFAFLSKHCAWLLHFMFKRSSGKIRKKKIHH